MMSYDQPTLLQKFGYNKQTTGGSEIHKRTERFEEYVKTEEFDISAAGKRKVEEAIIGNIRNEPLPSRNRK